MWPPLSKEDEPTFRSKKSMRAYNWMGTSFSNFSWGIYMKKWPRQATEENETKKKARECKEPIIYLICGLRHVQIQIIKSLLLDNFSLRSQQTAPNYFLYPYNYPEFHLRKIWPQFWANRHFPDGDGHDGGFHTNWQIKALPMACNRRELGFYIILPHSLKPIA